MATGLMGGAPVARYTVRMTDTSAPLATRWTAVWRGEASSRDAAIQSAQAAHPSPNPNATEVSVTRGIARGGSGMAASWFTARIG